ncbi:MAG: hypothetical protein JEY96_11870 [Bacteroidales bacterium]|nr:hypothetical protein [Bacteroidales bacterium]
MKAIKFLMLIVAAVIIYSCEYDSDYSSNGSSDTGTSGSLARFAIAGNYLYTVELEHLKVFDISVERSPMFIKQTSPGFGIETIFANGDYLFLGSRNGVYIYDISNRENPIQISYYTHVYSCDPVIVNGDYAYSTLNSSGPCGRGSNQLDVIDISDKSNPFTVLEIEMESPKGLVISDNLLFVCDNGIKIYDLTNPELPIFIKKEAIDAFDVIPIDDLLIVTAESGLYIYEISDTQLNLLSTLHSNI